jgi:hypothetical protein
LDIDAVVFPQEREFLGIELLLRALAARPVETVLIVVNGIGGMTVERVPDLHQEHSEGDQQNYFFDDLPFHGVFRYDREPFSR